jgi:thiol:disulfide interchange protein DsbA
MRRVLTALLFLLLPLAALAQPMAPGFREGVDYETLAQPIPTYAKGKIEIAEVFSYACVHCFHFQPEVNKFKQTMAKDVRWEYVPAAFGGHWDVFARAYFAAQILGVQQKTHDAVFNGIFVANKIKTGSPEELADLYASLGADRAKFLEAFNSPEATARLAKAREFGLRSGVQGTPTLIVNGKYRVMGREDTGITGMFRTAEFLVEKERQAAKNPKPAPAPSAPAAKAAAPAAKS